MIRTYLKIYSVLFKNAFSYEAHYRTDTWIKMITNILWIGMLLMTIQIIFSHTQTIAGWRKEEVYLMTLLWVLTDELFLMFFGVNLSDIPNKVTDGELDLYLTKPANILFLVSTKIFLTRSLYRFIVQCILFAWFVLHFHFSFSSSSILIASLLLLAAIIIDYAVVLIINTFSFWLLRIDNINDAWRVTRELGRYPQNILPKTIRITFLTIIPIAFTAYIPVATLTSRWPWYGVLYSYLFSILLLWIAIRFWKFALKRYTSASS